MLKEIFPGVFCSAKVLAGVFEKSLSVHVYGCVHMRV